MCVQTIVLAFLRSKTASITPSPISPRKRRRRLVASLAVLLLFMFFTPTNYVWSRSKRLGAPFAEQTAVGGPTGLPYHLIMSAAAHIDPWTRIFFD